MFSYHTGLHTLSVLLLLRMVEVRVNDSQSTQHPCYRCITEKIDESPGGGQLFAIVCHGCVVGFT